MKNKKKLHYDVYIGIIMLIFGLFFRTQTSVMPEQAAIYPNIILEVICVLSAGVLISGIMKTKNAYQKGEVPASFTWNQLKSPMAIAVIIFAYLLLMSRIGFYVSTAAFVAVSMFFFGERSVKRICLVTAGVIVALYIIFSLLLGVILPDGLLF